MDDYLTGVEFTTDPYAVVTVGPQNDGTYGTPAGTNAVMPYDAGGGPAKSYGADIMNLFKFGVGVWQADKNQTAMMDYRRFEATQNGLQQQGIRTAQARTATGGINPSLILFSVLIVAVALIAKG